MEASITLQCSLIEVMRKFKKPAVRVAVTECPGQNPPMCKIHQFIKTTVTLECNKPVHHSLLYDSKSHLKWFGLGGAVKPGEEEDDGRYELLNELQRCL